MADITWSDVVGQAAELSVVTVGAQTAILNVANTVLNVRVFGGEDTPKLKLARTLYAAHFGALSLSGSGNWTGQVIAETALGLSRQYASNSPTGTDPLWDKTSYGQLFRLLLRSTRASCPMVI